MMGVVEIRRYDQGWPAEFREVAARIGTALGDIATRIDHIGSTSVDGLDSKDVIDVQISVADEPGLELAATALESGGWIRYPGIGGDHRPPGSPTGDSEWRKEILTEPPGSRRVNAHVRVDGRANQRYALLFRDYLRTHPNSAQAYASLKKDLALLLPKDSDRYTDTKDHACDLVYFAAEEWAQVTRWHAGVRRVASLHDGQHDGRPIRSFVEGDVTWDPVAPLRDRPPDVTLEEASAAASRFFGVEASLSRLVSERDANFLVEEAGGGRFVLKIHNAADASPLVEMQTQALLHIAATDPSIPVQRIRPTLDGEAQAILERPDGSSDLVRMLTYVPGRRLGAADLALRAIEDFGASAARVGMALRDFSHPAADRPLLWDIKQGAALRPLLVHIEDPERRDLVDHWLSRFEDHVLPALGPLRTQVIHNDLTLDNVLFAEDGSVAGVVDLGDMVRTALVCDLAMLLASLIGDRPEMFEVAAASIRGYRSVTPLEEDELRVLADLIAMRAAANVTVSAWRPQLYPDKAAYISSWDAGSWVILDRFREIGAEELWRRFAGRLH